MVLNDEVIFDDGWKCVTCARCGFKQDRLRVPGTPDPRFLDATDNVALLLLAGVPNGEARQRALELMRARRAARAPGHALASLEAASSSAVAIARGLVNRRPYPGRQADGAAGLRRAMAVIRISTTWRGAFGRDHRVVTHGRHPDLQARHHDGVTRKLARGRVQTRRRGRPGAGATAHETELSGYLRTGMTTTTRERLMSGQNRLEYRTKPSV